MQELGKLLCGLCDHLNEAMGEEMRFLPGSGEGELPTAEEKPVSWVRFLPEAVVMHAYVDGTYRYDIPFAVYLRIDGSSPADHMAVLDRFGKITEILEGYATTAGRCKWTKLSGIEKKERGSAVVYRAGYCLSAYEGGE